MIERATARGCRRVELDVNTENPVAMALYKSLGFETGKTGGQDLLHASEALAHVAGISAHSPA